MLQVFSNTFASDEVSCNLQGDELQENVDYVAEPCDQA